MDKNFIIENTKIGFGDPCFIIAEVGLAHDGSLGMAHSYIDAVAKTGADAIKFQTHIASAESSDKELFRVKVFPQDSTRYNYWERTSFSENEWRGLKKHADEENLVFLSSPFSIEAVKLLRRIGISAWKIASGETNNLLILNEIAKGKEPVFLSSGMSYIKELNTSLKILEKSSTPTLLMQCTNHYPCPPEYLGLNMIQEYEELFNIPVGFSDHSGEVASGVAAVSLGAKALEVHITWHKDSFGPDVKASLTIEELYQLVHGVRIVEKALNNPIDKDSLTDDMSEMRELFTKGLYANWDIDKGDIIDKNKIVTKKPCIGIPVSQYDNVIGKVAKKHIKKDESITWEDLQ